MVRLRILAALLMLGAAGLFACSTKQAVDKEKGDDTVDDTVLITGQVHIYGSEPHTFPGIVSDDGKTYAIYPREKEGELSALQGRLIEFTVRFLEEPKGEGSLYLRDGTVTPLSWRILPPR
jgi:hypothetical protein